MNFLLIIFISLFSIASTKLVLPKSSPSQVYGIWKSSCSPTTNSFTRTYTNIRSKKTVIYQIRFSDKKCRTPMSVTRIRANSQLRPVKNMYDFNLKYRDISVACIKDCRSNRRGLWTKARKTSTQFLFTRLALDNNLLFYASTNKKFNGSTRTRRPARVNSTKFDTRANYLPIFLTPIK